MSPHYQISSSSTANEQSCFLILHTYTRFSIFINKFFMFLILSSQSQYFFSNVPSSNDKHDKNRANFSNNAIHFIRYTIKLRLETFPRSGVSFADRPCHFLKNKEQKIFCLSTSLGIFFSFFLSIVRTKISRSISHRTRLPGFGL